MDVFNLKAGMMNEDGARCIASKHLTKLEKCSKHPFRVDGPGLDAEFYGEPPMQHNRKMVLCETERGNRISYLWADSVSGVLFSPVTGECLTSPSLKIVQQGAKSGRGATKAMVVA